MRVVHTSRAVVLALVVGSAGCGTGTVGPPPAEPEANQDLTSASTSLRTSLQARAGDPLPGLSQALLARFAAGKSDEAAGEGLGLVFNDPSGAR